MDLLRGMGEQFERAGREWRWKGNHSVVIHGSKWYDHGEEAGGYPAAFFTRYMDYSYEEAMRLLLNGELPDGNLPLPVRQAPPEPSKKEPVEFHLPPANSDMQKLYSYLTQFRFLDKDVIDTFVREKALYESREQKREPASGALYVCHNAVFVGYDEHRVPRMGAKKGLQPDGPSYRKNVFGSDMGYSFKHIGTDDTLFVFEAPIDLMAYITLHPENWREHSYLTLNGVAEMPLAHYLETHSAVQKIFWCMDNDPAGIEAAEKFTALYGTDYDCTRLLSRFKDWDEDLKALHGQEAIPAKPHPRIAGYQKETAIGAQAFSEDYARWGSRFAEGYRRQGPSLPLRYMQEQYRRLCEMCIKGKPRLDWPDHVHGALRALTRYSAMAAIIAHPRFGEYPEVNQKIAENFYGKLTRNYRCHEDHGQLGRKWDAVAAAMNELRDVASDYRLPFSTRQERLIVACFHMADRCIRTGIEYDLKCQEQLVKLKPETSLAM